MIILETNQERKALQGILNFVWESNTCVWDSDESIDYDKAEYTKYLELKKHIQNMLGQKFFDDNDFDLCEFLYKLNGDN